MSKADSPSEATFSRGRLAGLANIVGNAWSALTSPSGRLPPPSKQASPVYPWPHPQTQSASSSSHYAPPPPKQPPTHTVMHKIYTPPATDVDMEEAEEEPKPNVNPAIRSVQAFPKAASSSLLDGSPFHQVVNIKRQGQDASAAPDESVKPASASRASSVSSCPKRSGTLC